MRLVRLRFGLILAPVLALMALAPATVDAVGVTCVKNGATAKITMVGASLASIERDDAGHIKVNGSNCGAATVTNIDTISVFGDRAAQEVEIHIGHGGFKPGLTNEPGSSDEIEIYLYLGAGGNPLRIYGSAQADNIRLGYGPAEPHLPRINLNAGETTGIDADVFSSTATGVYLIAGAGADTISAAGAAGTGDPYQLPVKVHGLAGADVITGGNGPDYLLGDDGPDTLRGGAGDDDLESDDGVAGNDVVNGGPGTGDFCTVDVGDTVTNCEDS